MIFDERDWRHLATLFNSDGVTGRPYAGYRPNVREAPNGDGRIDKGAAAKRWLHVALKYDPPAWALSYLARAHFEACRVAEALRVPSEYYPRTENGTLRVLEYPSAACAPTHPGGMWCAHCGRYFVSSEPPSVCPVLAAGAGTAEHCDFDLFTLNLWRSHPTDLETRIKRDPRARGVGPDFMQRGGEPVHIGELGELGELVGLGPATPHRVPARPYVQRSIIYFAMPAMAARLPGGGPSVAEWLAERLSRSRVYT